MITIPNKLIVGEILHNSYASLVVESSIGVAYDTGVNKAIALISEALSANPDVVNEPAAQVGIQQFADSAIELGFRYWVPTRKYYEIMYAVNNNILASFTDANIVIPYPQRNVHITGQSS